MSKRLEQPSSMCLFETTVSYCFLKGGKSQRETNLLRVSFLANILEQ